ncbi:MAG: hypothetical protein Q8P81_04070 [Nanoarchaeota archaeon]|nr:hypothetical protein [Nanoarchaeota archaeon]
MLGLRSRVKPLSYLDMELRLARRNFSSSLFTESLLIESVRNYGLAIDFAQKFVQGGHIVLEDGELLSFEQFRQRGYACNLSELDERGAYIDIECNVPGLLHLREMMGESPQKRDCMIAEGNDDPFLFPRVHFHYADGGINFIAMDRQGCIFLK